MKRVKRYILLFAVYLCWACSMMDDNTLPQDQFDQIVISDFEVNMDRDFIRGKIQNKGHHEVTSSIYKFEIYPASASPDSAKALLSQNFIVREPLKPNYSTEFYFELKMDYDETDFVYIYDIVQVKGR